MTSCYAARNAVAFYGCSMEPLTEQVPHKTSPPQEQMQSTGEGLEALTVTGQLMRSTCEVPSPQPRTVLTSVACDSCRIRRSMLWGMTSRFCALLPSTLHHDVIICD